MFPSPPLLVPSLLVRDMAATLAFYRRLGFRVSGRDRDETPAWAEVSGYGVVLQFHTEAPRGTPSEPVMSGTLYVCLEPGRVEPLAANLRGEVELVWGPEVMPYGMLEVAVRDPDGYFLAFTEPAPDPA